MPKVVYKRRDQLELELKEALAKLEAKESCGGCIYKPKVEGVDSYANECGACKRFYGDGHTTEEQRDD